MPSEIHSSTASRQGRLQDELARCCLPETSRDPETKLAWINSICLLFLLVGVFGARRSSVSLRIPPPAGEAVPVILDPIAPQPPAESEARPETADQPDKPEKPEVVVVTPETPAIHFAVPTIGNLLAPRALAQPPPLNPLQPPAAPSHLPSALTDTGASGQRPRPPYPRIALEQAQQGSVTLLISADDSGNINSVEVKESSGYPILDRGAVDYVKRHWTLPSGTGSHLFETTITYKLQAG